MTGNERSDPPAVCELQDLSVHFAVRAGMMGNSGGGVVRAVDGVDLRIPKGQTFGLVGESGSGKSTVGRVVMGMIRPTTGRVVFEGRELGTLKGSALRTHRRRVQIVQQNPYASLNPRMQVADIIAEPITKGLGRTKRLKPRIIELLERVGLPASSVTKYPHQFSGGQRQRIAIARALAPEPALIVLDEPTSALDVSVRAQILNLLRDLQDQLGVSYLLISHDLLTVAYMSSSIGVMYLGRIVESGPAALVSHSPTHPYTQLLFASDPARSDSFTDLILLDDDEIPSAMDIPTGCRFKTRCHLRKELGNPAACDEIDPQLVEIGTGQVSACHFTEQLLEGSRIGVGR